jgi:methyl-accepting chemotaxis protein
MRQNEILVLLAVVIFLLAARSIVRDRIVVSAQPLSTVTLSSAPTVAPGAKLDVDVRIRSSVMDITNAAALVRGNAERLGLLVKEAKQRSGAMHTAAGEAEDVTNKAAAAAEELSAAIGTIRTQVEKSGAVADRASDQAETLDRSIHTLAEASGRIDAAVATIGAIASRINLLALNATIESARAGDAGKGFAAIAAEVKDLAGHTANAREDILSQAQAMQQVTQQAAKSVSDLVAILGEINAATTIATTTAQAQQTATQAISRTLGDAATGTAKLSQSTRRIAQDTEESGASSKELLNSATALQQKVEAFLQTVRRA